MRGNPLRERSRTVMIDDPDALARAVAERMAALIRAHDAQGRRTVLGSENSSARICWKRLAASVRVGMPSYPEVGLSGMRFTWAGRPRSNAPTARACSAVSFFPSIRVHS